jgi:hypothetical protein
MTTRNERLSRLAVLSPCQEPWQAARRQLARDAAGEERLRARVAAVQEALRLRFLQALSTHP